jgi:hypothetical protein
MNQQTDRNNLRLIKMSAEEFEEPAHRHWYNRDLVFMALIVLAVIGMVAYHFVYGTQ